jgi:hypothetical protein
MPTRFCVNKIGKPSSKIIINIIIKIKGETKKRQKNANNLMNIYINIKSK